MVVIPLGNTLQTKAFAGSKGKEVNGFPLSFLYQGISFPTSPQPTLLYITCPLSDQSLAKESRFSTLGLDQTSHKLGAGHLFPEQGWGLLAGKKGNDIWAGNSRHLLWTKSTEPQSAYPSLLHVITSQLALGTPVSVHLFPTFPTTPVGSSWSDLSWVLKQIRCRQ